MKSGIRFAIWGALCGLLFVAFSASFAQAESSVWEVKGPKTTVYIAGSSHVLRASDHPLPAQFNAAYERAKHLIFEAPLEEMASPLYLQKLMAAAVYADGTTLKDHLSPATWEKTQKFCREKNHDCEKWIIFRPWMFSLMISMQEMAKLGVEPAHGVDQFFFDRAKNDGKTAGALETVDEQIGFLTMMDGGRGDEQVRETIDELRHLEGKLDGIIRAWRAGDEKGIEAFSLSELKNYPELYQALMIDRNKRWMREIERVIGGSSPTMIIVGVAHLAGTDSVIDLLRKRGFSVEKMKK